MMIEPEIIFRLLLLGLLLISSAFFAGSEVALFSLSKIEIDRIKKDKPKVGLVIEQLLQNPQKLLVTIYLGNEFTNVAISAVITVIALELFSDYAIALAIGVGTFLLLLFGEITPKSIAHNNSITWSKLVARPLALIMKLLYPAREMVSKISAAIVRLLGGSGSVDEIITEEDLLSLVEESADEGVIYQEEKDMIQAVFELGDMRACEIMTPRTELFAVDIATESQEAFDKLATSKFTRAPIYDGSIDNIIGVIYKKDLLKADINSGEEVTLRKLAREPFIIPETISINEVMREFRRCKTHMAIAMDEYGGVAGVVTLDDIIEELVNPDKDRQRLNISSDGWYRINASMSIEDFEEQFKFQLEYDETDTIGGYVFHKLKRAPRRNDILELEDITFKVIRTQGARITILEVLPTIKRVAD